MMGYYIKDHLLNPPPLRDPKDREKILEKLHERVYNSHIGGRALVVTAKRTG